VDAMGRIVAQKLSAALGQQVIIENRPGAGGIVAAKWFREEGLSSKLPFRTFVELPPPRQWPLP
jgi:tripartite-type tricarboxylate transporter receptor subunit TctC